MKAHCFSCEVDFTAGLPSMEYLGFSTKTMIVTQIYGTSNGEDDENPLERGSFPVSFHVFPGKLSRREQRGSAAAEAGFQWRWFVGLVLGEHSLVWFLPISLGKPWMGTDFSALLCLIFCCCKWEDQNKLNTEFLDTLSQLMGDADEHQILMNNARIFPREITDPLLKHAL